MGNAQDPAAVMPPNDAWRELLNAATQPYRAAGTFAYHFARGKLGRDPVFQHLVSQGLLRPPAVVDPGDVGRARGDVLRVLDIGSGQGLLASLMQAMHQQQHAGAWPTTWPKPASTVQYCGVELMPKDVARAQAALTHWLPQGMPTPQLICGNMCDTPYPASDVVVILDVLHYVDIAAQDQVLQRVHDALRPGGRLLLRIGDQSSPKGFRASQWVDRVVTNIRGHRAPPTWGRPLAQWVSVLESLGFQVKAVPKSEGTPFANVLLVADR
jgi:SAM-dependent methyltransferase